MANLSFGAGNERLNMVPTVVIWKWQQYEKSHYHIWPFPARVEDTFFNLSANNPKADSLNHSDI